MIIWESRAEQELQEIYDHIYLNSPQNADLVVDELILIAENINNMPYKHPKELYFDNEKIRFVAKWKYKIIYEIGDIDIFILYVFNTSQTSLKIGR